MADLLTFGGEELAGLGGKLASSAYKAGRIASEDTTEDPFYGVVDLPHVKGAEEAGYSAFLLAPSAQAQAVELNLTPFASNVGTYLADNGILPDNGWVKLGVDLFADFGNLLPLGTLTKATAAAKRARVISRVMEGGLKGKTGAAVVDALHGVVEMAGKMASVAPEVQAAAKLGDRAAVKAILDAAVAAGKPGDEALELMAALKKDRKALAELLEGADELASMGDLGPSMFEQATRLEKLNAGHITPLVGVVQPIGRDPIGTLRRLAGFNYQSEIMWMPGSNLIAQALDVIRPLKAGTELADDSLSVGSFLKRAAASQKLAEEMLGNGGLRPFHLDMLADRFSVMTGAQNERSLRLLASGDLDEKGVKEFAKALTGKKEPSDEDIVAARQMLLGDVVDRQRRLDTHIKEKRDALLADLTQKRRDAWASPSAIEAMGAVDSAMVEADVSDLRAVWELWRLPSITGDGMGLGQALRARAAYGSFVADQMAFGTREVLSRSYPKRGDRELVSSAMARVLDRPELWEVREGRLFLKEADPEKLRTAGAHRLAKMLEDTHNGARLSEVLTQQGLSGEVAQITNTWRRLLDATGETLVSDGVLFGTIPNYFPLVFTPSKKFYDTFKVSEKAQHQFFEVALARSEMAEIVLGAEGSAARKLSDDTLALAREGKLGWAQAREWTEDVAVRMEEQGYGTYEQDAIKVFHAYLDATNKALLVNRVFLDLPKTPVTIGASRWIADKNNAKGLTEAQMNGLPVVVDEAGYKALPLAAKEGYTELTSTGRVLGELDDIVQLQGKAAADAIRRRIDPHGLSAYTDDQLLNLTEGSLKSAREKVAKELEGKTEVAGVQITGRKGGKKGLSGSWVRQDSYPESVQGYKQIRSEVDKMVRAQAAKDLRDQILALEGKGGVAEASRLKVYVYKPDAAHLQEAFRLWSQNGDTPGWLRALDRWNANLKGWVLFGDFFHFNTMAVSSLVGDPQGVYRALRDDAGKLLPGVREGGLPSLLGNAVGRTGLGAAGGLATGAAMGADDPESLAGFSLAGALYGAAISAAIRNGKAARLRSFNPMGLEDMRRMGMAGWAGRPDDRALGTVQRSLRALRADLIRRGFGRSADALTGGLHVMDAYEETMWGVLNNGGKQAYFGAMWQPAYAKLQASAAWKAADTEGKAHLERQIATELMQGANNAFGGQSYANLFTDPTFQYHVRRFLISPDWTSSRLAWTASMMGNMGPVKQALLGGAMGTMVDAAQAGFDPDEMSARGPVFGAAMGVALGKWNKFVVRRMRTPGDAYATAGRKMGAAALLGGFATYNLLNYAFTGHFMWDNEEGRRLSVQLPNGQVYSPGKPFVEAFEWAAIKDTKTYPDPVTGRLRTKLAPVPGAFRIVLNRDSFGGPIISAGASPSDVLYKYGEIAVQSTFPIGLRGFGELGIGAITGSADATDASQAIFGVAGLPVKGKVGMVPGQALSIESLQSMLAPPSLGDPTNLLSGRL